MQLRDRDAGDLMQHSVGVAEVGETPLVVVRRRATLSDLSKVVPDACGVVWEFIRRSHIASHGRNVAVYLNDEMDVEVGVEVEAGEAQGKLASEDEVVLSSTPAGRVAATCHVGPYTSLGDAHRAIRDWCSARGYELAGPNWEVYGHVREPGEPSTDVLYLLRGTDDAGEGTGRSRIGR